VEPVASGWLGVVVVPSPVALPVCGVVSVTPGAGKALPPPWPMARCICSCARIISGLNSIRRSSGFRSICCTMGLSRTMGLFCIISITAGLFMASFICDRNIGLSIMLRSWLGSGGGPIYRTSINKLLYTEVDSSDLPRHQVQTYLHLVVHESLHIAHQSIQQEGYFQSPWQGLWAPEARLVLRLLLLRSSSPGLLGSDEHCSLLP